MAIYRTNRDRRLGIVGVVALVVGVVGGLAVGRLTAPGLTDQLAALRTQAAPITTSLEVVRSEYPKLLAGGADAGGSVGALARVRSTYDLVLPTLTTLDPAGTGGATAALEALEAGVASKASEADIDARIDSFRTALAAALGTGTP
jgi:hypothetical protein